MRVHKEIKIDIEEMEKFLKDEKLARRARYWIEDYNQNKYDSISFTFTWNLNKCQNWGYVYGGDIKKLDDYFVGVLGMKEVEERAWDNKTCDKYYFFKE